MKKGIIATIAAIAGAAGGIVIGKAGNKALMEKAKKVDKFKSYYNLLNHWLDLKREGRSPIEYFHENHIKTIAVYGMGELGNHLYHELKDTDVELKYAIDKDTGAYSEGVEVYSLDDSLESVDAIVVTAIFAFHEIEEELSNKMNCQIISLEDVIYWM